MLNFLVTFIPRAIMQGIPLLYGCTGETISEKSLLKTDEIRDSVPLGALFFAYKYDQSGKTIRRERIAQRQGVRNGNFV